MVSEVGGEIYIGQDSRSHDQEDFYHRMARRLQQMLEDVRERHDHLTIWLCPDIKKLLYVHWETDEGFKHRRLTNRANRTSAKSSKYTSGSTTFMKTKARLIKSYTQRLEVATKQSQRIGDDDNNFAALVVDPDQVWREAASEPYKNRMYKFRSFFADNLRTSTLIHSSTFATSRPIDPKNGVDLREHVLLLTWSLHQQAQ
ncbi:hypothetical protein Ahy_B03g061869 [Arachis hypogaea]|uniref:Uncharacterized protein n=1 Tax=Arachis hypogaea TaxID=3818 RepID=A0A444ZSC0_ARAHY|nr:hypothetical protein Ahy_B03g061869 [Arachis hypogaea]